MKVFLDKKQANFLLKHREQLSITRQDLCHRTHISYRTLTDVEHHHRSSFHPKTIRSICNVLEIDYDKFITGEYHELEKPIFETELEEEGTLEEDINTLKKHSRLILIFTVLIIGILFILVGFQVSREPPREDYIIPYDKNKWPERGRDATASEDEGQIINFIDMNRNTVCGEDQSARMKWSYNYKGLPEIYINFYTEWEPDLEHRLFHGVVTGTGGDLYKFQVISPSKPGKYKIRFFHAKAHAPIRSFYGSPGEGSQYNPVTAPFHEIEILVLPEEKH
ncbi:MAG: helix-turn-helix transcriptional regulator [bacterium]